MVFAGRVLSIVPVLAALALALPACTGGSSGGGGRATSASSAGTGGLTTGGASGATILAGSARVDCTPVTGCPLGGYGGGARRSFDPIMIPANVAALFGSPFQMYPGTLCTLFEPSQGKHDAICAKAVVIDRGGERWAIVSVDAVGVSRRVHDTVAQEIAATGIASDHLLICATHCHSGPGVMTEKKLWAVGATDLFQDSAFQPFVTGIAQSVVNAAANLVPARIGTASEPEMNASHNRRGHSGVFDPELSTITVERADKTTIALLVNFAVHGVCLDENNMLFSADLLGYVERDVEATLGHGAVCCFLNGAEGDVSPNDFDYAGAETLGQHIATHALSIQQTASTNATTAPIITSTWEDYTFPTKPALRLDKVQSAVPGSLTSQVNLGVFQQFLNSVAIDMDDTWLGQTYPFMAIRIGDAVLACVPGEALTEVGLGIKAQAHAAGFTHAMVIGLANDHMGYCCDPIEFDLGGYEAALTFFGRDESSYVTDTVMRQVNKIRP